MDLKKYDLYILDYDGCLLDSMPMWRSSASNFIKSLGYQPKDNLDERIPIFTDIESGLLLKEEYNLDYSINELMDKIDNYVNKNYEVVKLKDGALSILKKLKEMNKKIILLSASGIDILKLNLKYNHIYDYFNEVISIYNHETLSKVSGSAISYVMDKYNINKDKTIIIDDSLSTILSANKLGVDSIAIYDSYSSYNKEDELKQNAKMFLKLNELSELI